MDKEKQWNIMKSIMILKNRINEAFHVCLMLRTQLIYNEVIQFYYTLNELYEFSDAK